MRRDRPALGLARRLRQSCVVAGLLMVAGPALAQPTWRQRVAALETPEVRRRIVVANVGGTSALVLGRAAVEGEVDGVGDAAQAAAWGAVAGAGFFAAKDLSGRGYPALGLGLAALAGSLAENAATGGGPFGHVRVPLGIVDLRVRTPLATRSDGPVVGIEADPLVIGASLVLPLRGGRPTLRRGVAVFQYEDLGGGTRYRREGRTVGRVMLIEREASDRVLSHEVIHRIQALQVGAVTPGGTVGAFTPGLPATAASGDVAFDVRAEWLYVGAGVLTVVLSDYLDRWPEIEARALDEPPRP